MILLGLIGAAALIYGLVRYKSLVGVVMAIVYIGVTLIVVFLSQRNLLLESAGWVLTLPWNAVLPYYGLDRSCTLSLAVSFICAELNAAILYFLTVWLSWRK